MICVLGALAVCRACPGGFEGFGLPVPYALGDGPVAVAVGDINNDGVPDFVTANDDDATISVRFGLGDGTFGPTATVATTENPTDISLSDVDNDGNLDAIVYHRFVPALDSDFAISVHLDQDGLFGPPTVYRMGDSGESLGVGDLNADGLEDIVVTGAFDGSVSVRLGNADGTFGAREVYPGGLSPRVLALGDVTGDGVIDVVVNSGQFTPRFYVLPGLGDGALGTPQQFTLPATVSELALRDLNHDGLLDFVGTTGSDSAYVRLGLAGGDFEPAETLSLPTLSAQGFVLVDLNGDTHLDLVVASHQTLGVRLGNGDGTFQPLLTYPSGAFPSSLAHADFNGDASPDVVVTSPSADLASVLLNQATFLPAPFALLAPADGAEGLPLPAVVAGWSPAALSWEPSTSAPIYRVEIATDSDFLSPIFDTDGLSDTSVEVPLGVLAPSTRYYWRVTASNAGGDRGSTPAYATFTTTRAADLNGDGVVDSLDLAALLAGWGD